MESRLNQEIIQLRDKADKFTRLRLKSAIALMKEDEADVFRIFPLLLHLIFGCPDYRPPHQT